MSESNGITEVRYNESLEDLQEAHDRLIEVFGKEAAEAIEDYVVSVVVSNLIAKTFLGVTDQEIAKNL